MATNAFPIVGLGGSPPSLKTLSDLTGRCRRMPENEQLCRQVLHRLELLHDAVAQAPEPPKAEGQTAKSQSQSAKAQYMDVVVRFVALLRRKPLLHRLASSETLVLTIRGLQDKLSEVSRKLGRADDPELSLWEQQWEADRAQQYSKLAELVTAASDRMLVNEIRGDKKVQEMLMTLNRGISWKGQTPDMVALKQEIFNRVSSYHHQKGLKMFTWFIPIDDIEYEDEAIGDRGTFGDVRRGSWLHDGQRTEVAVKLLFPEMSSDSDGAFLRQLELWGNLPENEHILKLYGGSHVSNPQFYVCENAPNGNLFDFLVDEKTRVLFWRMFKQVVLGLQFLHGRDTIHGGLKCTNILVGANSTAKLADFGFSSVRTLSAGLSANGDKANAESVRWKPKEVLEELDMNAVHFHSDIYSLAMCMIEVRSHAIPFWETDDDEILSKLMKGESYPRVEGFSDDEWAFVSRLCSPDFQQRPSLDQVLKEISAFADAEEKQHPMASHA